MKMINLILEFDITYLNQIELKYLSKLKKLLYIISCNVPFQPNVSKLANDVETSRATIMNYLKYLKNARLIRLLNSQGSFNDASKKPNKVCPCNQKAIITPTMPKGHASMIIMARVIELKRIK